MENVAKKISKKDWITIGIVTAVSIGLGFTTGFLIKRFATPSSFNYDSINIYSYLPKSEEILERYEKDKNLQHYTDGEIVNIAQEKYRQNQHTVTICKGTSVSGIVYQTIRSNLLRNESQYCEESISSSAFVNLANRSYQTLNEENIKRYEGNVTGNETASFTNEPSLINLTDYQKTYGKSPDQIFTYIISNKTIKSSARKMSDDNSKMIIDLEMDPIFSTYYYVKQMKNVSNLGKYPSFEYVKLKIEIEKENLSLKKMSVQEKYYAELKSKVGSTLTSELEFTFQSDKVCNIPGINEKMDYNTL